MAIGIDEIDDDDLELDDENLVIESDDDTIVDLYHTLDEDDENDDDSQGDVNDGESIDALTQFLKDNGIDDPSKIKFEDENGEVQERSWDDLSGEELLNILRSNQREPEEGLDDEEIAFINQLRSAGISPSQYILNINEQFNALLALAQQAPAPEPTYTSDLFTDDELFVLDLLSRVPDLTDDELANALTKAKEDEEFFNKQMAGIRADYLRIEQENLERETAIANQQLLEAYQLYSDSIRNEIANFLNIGDLDVTMDIDDMDELADFILSSDSAGVNYFSKALQDPKTLVLMAWFALHGEEIFNGISDYYNKEILRASRDGYNRGKASMKSQEKASVYVLRLPKQTTNKRVNTKSIEDFDDED